MKQEPPRALNNLSPRREENTKERKATSSLSHSLSHSPFGPKADRALSHPSLHHSPPSTYWTFWHFSLNFSPLQFFTFAFYYVSVSFFVLWRDPSLRGNEIERMLKQWRVSWNWKKKRVPKVRTHYTLKPFAIILAILLSQPCSWVEVSHLECVAVCISRWEDNGDGEGWLMSTNLSGVDCHPFLFIAEWLLGKAASSLRHLSRSRLFPPDRC